MNASHTQPTVLRPQNFSELVEFARWASRSTMLPRDYIGKPENIMIAVQMGSELGLAPMQALQNISVINGRPAVWGDAMLGLCKASPVCEDIEERFEGDGDKLVSVCIAKRAGKKPVTQMFSVEDAKKANLWTKAGSWKEYPRRMLQMRARGFALRDAFPDVLRGLISVEEAQDIPPDPPFAGTTLEAKAEAPVRQQPAAEPAKMTWKEWADSLEIAVRDAKTNEELGLLLARAEVVEIYRLAKEGPYHALKARICDAVRDAETRYLADPPEPQEDEVVIAGAENVAAG